MCLQAATAAAAGFEITRILYTNCAKIYNIICLYVRWAGDYFFFLPCARAHAVLACAAGLPSDRCTLWRLVEPLKQLSIAILELCLSPAGDKCRRWRRWVQPWSTFPRYTLTHTHTHTHTQTHVSLSSPAYCALSMRYANYCLSPALWVGYSIVYLHSQFSLYTSPYRGVNMYSRNEKNSWANDLTSELVEYITRVIEFAEQRRTFLYFFLFCSCYCARADCWGANSES